MRTLLMLVLFCSGLALRAQDEKPPPEDERPGRGEVVRKWNSLDGKQTWTGKFWRIDKGHVEICGDNPEEPFRVPLKNLNAQDLAHLLSFDRRVVWASFQVARAGYVWDHDKNLLQRDKSLRRVKGKVDSVITDELMVVTDVDKVYAVKIPTRRYRKGRAFEGELRPVSKTRFDLGDGRKAHMCAAYFAITNYKAFREAIRSNPRAYVPVMAGSSHAYRTWLAGQKRVEEMKEHAEKRKEIADERARIRAEEEEAQRQRAQELKDDRRRGKVEARLKDLKNKKKDLEFELKKQEYRKEAAKRFTKKYNRARSRIHELKNAIKTAADLIEDLEEELQTLQPEKTD